MKFKLGPFREFLENPKPKRGYIFYNPKGPLNKIKKQKLKLPATRISITVQMTKTFKIIFSLGTARRDAKSRPEPDRGRSSRHDQRGRRRRKRLPRVSRILHDDAQKIERLRSRK